MTSRSVRFALAPATLALLLSGHLAAQGPAAGEAGDDESRGMTLEEVTVTAQRREESLQEVPVSVTAIAGDRVREGGIMNLADVAVETPNFTMTQFNIGEPQYFLRGIGNSNDSAGSDPAVGVFVDDVYIGRTGGTSTDLFDVERIEVIRGPHGTLFGKNVVGGAVSIYTGRPSHEFSGKVGATVGNYDQYMVRGLLNGSMTENLAGKISFSSQQREGYVDNVLDGLDYHDADNFSARGQMLYTPNEDLEILFGLDYSRDDQNGNCRNVNNLDKNDPLGLAVFYPPVIAQTTGGDIRKCASDAGAGQKREVSGALLRVDWDLDAATLTSITAYRDADYKWTEDLAGMPLGTTPFNLIDQADEESDQFSQEFRLTSSGGERFDWLLGAFYMEENVDRAEQFIGSFHAPLAAQGFVLLNGDVTWDQDNTTQTKALFGKLDWHLTDRLTWSIGGRWTEDDKDIDQAMVNNENPAFDIGLLTFLGHPNPAVVLGIPANGPADLIGYIVTGNPALLKTPYRATASDSWNEFLPSTSLSWRVSDDHLLYLSYSEGYKSGAFQSQTTTAAAAVTPLDPELAENYEIGVKSEFLGNRLRVNASAFTMDYTDLQVFQLVGSLLVGGNAEATSRGFELDAAWLLTDNWMISGNYGYLDAEYDVYILGNADLSGNDLPRAPENSWGVNTTYTVGLAGGSAMDFYAVYSYTDDFWFTPENQASSFEDGYGLLDARVTWRSRDDRWNVALWGRNLTDEEYRTHMIVSNIAGSVDLWNLPRTYGATVTYNF